MSCEERRGFVQFMWGRSRLPSTVVGFGKDVFKISDQVVAGNPLKSEFPDAWLPVAHTCFFSLELPRYSSKEIMRERIVYAIQNCRTIDADQTQRRNEEI
eukprot:TRINITY_DN13102_c0_g1_i1.p1 TRINITY_DN13102_c0_g1~~TRINITY_DN13102_c0_g1_i1.p1  ORF type:complete len:100 (-),score=14.37 TRINITY_DN13102_c0_g1_i1:52-351(-)